MPSLYDKEIRVVTEESYQGLKHVLGARDKSQYRRELRGVFVDSEDGCAIATDGHKLFAAKVCMEGGLWDVELGKNPVAFLSPISGEYPLDKEKLEQQNSKVPDADTFDIIMSAEDLRAVFARLTGPVRIRIRSIREGVEFFGKTRKPFTPAYALVMPLKWHPDHDKELVWRPWGAVSVDPEVAEEGESDAE